MLVYRKYTLLDRDSASIYAYTREGEGKKFLVLLNFKNIAASVDLPADIKISAATLVLSNYDKPSGDGNLQPYEAAVYELAP